MRPNYIGDMNPWSLVAPPASFLRTLAARDADLVLMPGLTDPVYRLARRSTRTQGLVTAVLGHQSETARMIRHRLVPVTSFVQSVSWGTDVIQWLDDHDIWKVGGGEKAADIVEQQDAIRLKNMKRSQSEEALARGGAGWRAKKLRAGETIFLPGHMVPAASHQSPVLVG